MKTSWRALKNRTTTKPQQAYAHKLAMRDLRKFEISNPRKYNGRKQSRAV